METTTRNLIKKALFKAYDVKSVSALLNVCHCARNVSKFNSLKKEDILDYLAERHSDGKDTFVDFPALISKINDICKMSESETELKCGADTELFEGGFNKDFIIAYLIKQVEDKKDCWKIDIELSNGSKYSRYGNSQMKREWLSHFKSLPNWV